MGPGRRQIVVRWEAAAWPQARAKDHGTQGMSKALGPVSSTDANALAQIYDDTIIHMWAFPNPIMFFLWHICFLDF